MRKILLLMIVVLLTSLSASAYDFMSGGIAYNITNSTDKTVEVTYKEDTYNSYSGDFIIPSTVYYGNTTYSVTRIGANAFRASTGLTSVRIPESVTEMGGSAFQGCTGLTNVVIPGNMAVVNSLAFYNCTSLKNVVLGYGVTTIGPYAFANCSALTEITCWANTPPTMSQTNCFSNYTKPTLYVYDGCVSNYQSNTNWSKFTKLMGMTADLVMDGKFYNVKGDNSVEVTSRLNDDYNCYSGRVTIPSTITLGGWTFQVTTIGTNAFRESVGLTSVTIPSSVTTISEGAFYHCTGLTSLTIPNSVTTINNHAFVQCTGLKSVTIPASVTSIGLAVFAGCDGLTTLKVASGNSVYDSRDNCNAIISKSENALISGCKTTVIPNTVTVIAPGAFGLFSDLTSMTIPNSVTYIGEWAFYGSGLTKVTIGSGVTDIKEEAFKDCTSLTTITCLSEMPPTIQESTFDSSHYTNATLKVPAGSQVVYQAADYWRNFTQMVGITYDFEVDGIYYNITGSNNDRVEVTYSSIQYNSYSGVVNIPSTVTYDGVTYNVKTIGSHAFFGSSGLTEVTIPSSVTSIGELAFSACTGLSSVTVPNSVVSMGTMAFGGCTGLSSFRFPDGITSATGQGVLLGCTSLTSVDFNKVKTISMSALRQCSSLTSVTIPSTVTTIKELAFNECTSLTSITSLATTPPTIQETTFDSSHYTAATLMVPAGCKAAYQTAQYWQNFTHIITPVSYDFEKNGIYYNITGTNPNTVEVTYNEPSGNNYTGSVVIPQNVTYNGKTYQITAIGDSAFMGCIDLSNVTIPNTVTTIGEKAFSGCFYLQNVTIPNSVTSIAQLAFNNCRGFTSVVIPNSVTSMGSNAFANCSNMTELVISNSLATIPPYAFANCDGLTEVTIPASVTRIKAFAFSSGQNLTSVICLATVPPAMETKVFHNDVYANATLTVPMGSLAAYQAAQYWQDFTHIVELHYDFEVDGIYYLISSPTTVEVTYRDSGHNSYSGDVVIPATVTYGGTTYRVTSIGSEAFLLSEGMTSIILPESVTIIGYGAFNMCTGLETLTLPNSLNGIADCAFMNCKGLTSITIPENVSGLGSFSFRWCDNLTSVTIGSAVTHISMGAFDGCDALTTINCLATTPPTIQSDTFTSGQYENATLNVPSASPYQAAQYWQNFLHIVGMSQPGDVNGDDKVSIADVTFLINMLLSNASDNPAADINGDGKVSIADVTALINFLLSGSL